jgi:hypothetical protein
MWSAAPALSSAARCDPAPRPRQRQAAPAPRQSPPASGRSVRRPLGTCGACGRRLGGIRPRGAAQRSQDGYDQGSGHAALTVGRTPRGVAPRVRAERLAALCWQARAPWRPPPSMLPHLPQTWATAQQPPRSGRAAPHAPWVPRPPRLTPQDHRVLAAYQTEGSTLRAPQARRQQLPAAWPQSAPARQHLAPRRPPRLPGHQVLDKAAPFRHVWGLIWTRSRVQNGRPSRRACASRAWSREPSVPSMGCSRVNPPSGGSASAHHA